MGIFFLFMPFFSLASSLPWEGKRVYTIQVGSFIDKEKAEERVKKIEDLPYARISYRNGRYKVRVGFFKSSKEAEAFIRKFNLREKIKDFYITRIRFSSKGVNFLSKGASQTVTNNKTFSKKEEVKNNSLKETKHSKENKSTKIAVANASTEAKVVETKKEKDLTTEKDNFEKNKSVFKKEDFTESKVKLSEITAKDIKDGKKDRKNFFVKLFLIAFLLILIVLFILSKLATKLMYRKEKNNSINFQLLISKLLKEENYEKIIDVAVPYLIKNPHDTFVKKAVAESFEKIGRYLEAAAIYSELSKDLEEKELKVLAQEFERKSEEVLKKEFKGRR
ncbi:SPOR domain-containing protein [Desulfurobacterium thermolithotrophum]|uniref:SPOR domain-containing protein n=1 Tax=Desulfurobacterium thermolithotrophum TaxID=64160 RepID=UPI0013D353CB